MFKNRIAYWANEKGMKYKALAKHCGVSAQTFSSWVNNKTQPDLKHSWLLTRMLGISLDELVGDEEEK